MKSVGTTKGAPARRRSPDRLATSLLQDRRRPSVRQLNQRRQRALDRATQLGTQLLRDAPRIDAVANDLRTNEDDELRPPRRVCLVGKSISEPVQLLQDR